MRTLELKDNELYLDGIRLSCITDLSIKYKANNINRLHYCQLKVKGIVLNENEPVNDGYGDLAIYEIDEEVELVVRKPLYKFVSYKEEERRNEKKS